MIGAAVLICLMPTPSDGDSARCGASQTTIRLFGVNAPETGTPGAGEAKAAFQAYSSGGLTCEPRGTSYSRIVAICSNSKGEDVGRLLLDAGLVKEVCSYSVSRQYPQGYYRTCP